MNVNVTDDLGFTAEHDVPIPTCSAPATTTRRWAMARLRMGALRRRAVSSRCASRWRRCRVALITTAAPYQAGQGRPGSGRAVQRERRSSTRSTPATPRIDHDLRISHVAIDRKHTTAEDPGTYFPLPELRRAAAPAASARVAPRFHGAPTNRSQRATLERRLPGDRRALPRRCASTRRSSCRTARSATRPTSLAARLLEAERHRHGGHGLRQGHRRARRRAALPVLRLPARQRGRPARTIRRRRRSRSSSRCALLEAAPAARTTVQSPLRWSASADWKLDYCNVARLTPDEIARRRAEFDEGKTQAKALREQS